ncbi:ATP-binding protein [Spirosoma panaciterrae]|uniref:ATP-binding protein n=1 Tax=Spirosoma panaciterrae TaxID=496058 RepID=UPI00146E1FE3|nr:ATP-binding protein [Spirosoma panaciterrae]
MAESITDRQGLPQAFVPAITQDQRGFIWMATLDGLCRYDGTHFNVFQPDDDGRSSLSVVGVKHLTRDSQGLLWVAGERTIDLFDPFQETFTHIHRQPFYKPFSDYRLTEIVASRRGQLWVVFLNQGLARLDPGARRVYHYRHVAGQSMSLTSNQVRTVLEDRQGFLWVATSAGLDRLDPQTNQFTHYHDGPNSPVRLPEQTIVGLYERQDGCLLLASPHFLSVFEPRSGTLRSFTIPHPIRQADLVQFASDSRGNDYLAYNNLVFRFKEQVGLHLLAQATQDWQIQSMHIDRSDVLWIGTNGLGVRRYNLQAMQFDARPYQTNFYTDLLVHQLGVPMSELPSFPQSTSSYNFRYTLDSKQNLWFTVGNAPFYQLDLHSRLLTTIPVPTAWQKTDGHSPISLTTDPKGHVWAICDSAAIWFDHSTRRWKSFPYRVRPNYARVSQKTTVFQAVVDEQAIWVSTGSRGLYRVNRVSGHIQQFAHQPGDSTSLSSNTLFCISSDPADPSILWVGTFGGGLCRFDKRTGRCQRFTKQDGLPNNVIYAAIPDQRGYLWVATNQGLCRITRPAARKPLQLQTYNRKDGLLADEFNRFHFLHLPNDRILLGGLEGITAFNPAALSDDRYQPPVELTDLRINNRPVQARLTDSLPIQTVKQLVLNHDQNFLMVGFAALQYNNTDKLRYRYQLEGIDRGWILADRPEAVYTNLEPGTYTLRLNASNTSGIWSPHVRVLSVIIHPPWWKSWWAYLIYLLAGSSGIVVVFRGYWRRKEAEQLKAMDEMKTRFFSNITHEFRTPLTLILAPVQQLQRKLHDPDDLRKVATIDRNAHQLLGLVNQLMDLSKLEAGALQVDETRGDVVQFVDDVVQLFIPQAETKGIRLQFSASELAQEYYFDARKLERILYNLVANALKFTPSGGLIDVYLAPSITLTVSDSGIGIPADKRAHIFERFYQTDDSNAGITGYRQQEGTGIGLALVKELVDLQKGSITVTSEVGQGSTFTVVLPYRSVTLNRPAIDPNSTSTVDPTETSTDERSDESPVILLVEDNPELAEFIADSFPTSYLIYRAANGADGLGRAIELMPDLIISDVLMPVMTGYALCEQLKADTRTSHIPVVLLTAKSSPESRIEGLAAGADDYITKPFSVQELQLRIRNRLEQRRQLREWVRSSLILPDPLLTEAPPDLTTDTFLDQIYDLIEASLDNSAFGADELIGQTHLSRMSLHRKLKAMTGMSAGELIRTYRLRRAADFLQQGYTSSETAYRVGFDSPAYFSKCFREMYQLTPTEYVAARRR